MARTRIKSSSIDTTTGAGLPVGTTAQRPASPAVGTMRLNTTTQCVEVYYSGIWTIVASVAPTFTAEVLAVAGGGAGGGGGGGGAGGLLYYGSESVTNRASPNGSAQTFTRGTTYTITIGAGGSVAGGSNIAAQGGNTTISGTGVTISATGGGSGSTSITTYGGGSYASGSKGANGGSGGGAGGNSAGDGQVIPGGSGVGTTTTDRQGYSGGSCPSLANSPAGGGGGAGGAGGNGSSGTSGNGGVGLQYSINGTATYYAGGGGGGGYNVTRGTGGAGGGGTGGLDYNSTNSTAGSANTGGGGGGTGSGGLGGSGIVIIRYAATTPYGTGGSITSAVINSITYQIHTFTTSGSFVL